MKNINYDEKPKQSDWLNRKVVVCYNYETDKTENGVIVRCDEVQPGIMLIQLESGFILRSTECQYRLI